MGKVKWFLMGCLIAWTAYVWVHSDCRPTVVENVNDICFHDYPFGVEYCYAFVRSKDGELSEFAELVKPDSKKGKEINYCFKK